VVSNAAEVFAKTRMFTGAPVDLSVAIGRRSKYISLDPNEVLFREGDNADGFYAVETGGLKATRLSPDGNEQLIALFSDGEVIGEMAIFDEFPRSATITALKPSTVIFCSRDAFFEFADENPPIYRHMLSMMAGRLRATNDSLAARDFLALPGQLSQALTRLADGFGREMVSGSVRIEYKLTQSELGAMIGASRENVSRVLNQWKRAGLISRVDGFYHIDKRQELMDVVES